MRNSDKERTIGYIEELPEETEKVVKTEPSSISKTATVSFDGRQFVVRIPNEISKNIGIEKGDIILFEVKVPSHRSKEKPELSITFIGDKK